jgi:hypothetical protein
LSDSYSHGWRVTWELPNGIPVLHVRVPPSLGVAEAFDLAQAIEEAASAAHAEVMKSGAVDLFSDLSRRSDPATSKAAGDAMKIRGASQKADLLRVYIENDGLTDEEAGELSGLASKGAGYWKRCSELRRAGYIVPTGETREGTSGMDQLVCEISDSGRAAFVQAIEEK